MLNKSLTANNKQFYFDYKNGKYGYNTSPSRGADTFVPFSIGISNSTKLGSYSGRNSQTIDCKSIPNYNLLSADNFHIVLTAMTRKYETSNVWNSDIYSATITKSYNSATGTLTISSCLCGSSNGYTMYPSYDVYY